MSKTGLVLPQLDDMHCHFRSGQLLDLVLPFTAKYAGRGVAMPNIKSRPIRTADDVVWYHDEIERVLDKQPVRPDFTPLMTIEVNDETTPAIISAARRAGAVAGKVYPRGVTTNSDEGLTSFSTTNALRNFAAMQDVGMLLLIHGEFDRKRLLVTNREYAFLPTLAVLAFAFPALKIVLEHVSTKAGVQMVKALPKNVAATITVHHLMLTLNDVIGDGVRPHNACMPTPKDFDDRRALRLAAMSGNPKFFPGSDTAPHRQDEKECEKGKCGVFSAPVLPSALVEVFEDEGALDRLPDFVARFGAQFYGLPRNTGTIRLVREEWTVPAIYGNVVPFLAKRKMRWKLV